MKLYYFPGACSMASHIIVKELELPVDLIRVDLMSKTTEAGDNFFAINPEGYVPALALDDGTVLTESAAVLQYLADSAAPNPLLPPVGDIARYRVIELQAYVSTELHQSIGPLVNPVSGDDAKAAAVAKIQGRLGRLERLLADMPFLTGPEFTIADAYAFAILGALRHFSVPMDQFSQIGAFAGRVGGRPATVAMLRAEGLMP